MTETVHVYPIEDWIEHRNECDHLTCDCPCEPRIEVIVILHRDYAEYRYIVVHNQVEPQELAPEPRESERWHFFNWLRSFIKGKS